MHDFSIFINTNTFFEFIKDSLLFFSSLLKVYKSPSIFVNNLLLFNILSNLFLSHIIKGEKVLYVNYSSFSRILYIKLNYIKILILNFLNKEILLNLII